MDRAAAENWIRAHVEPVGAIETVRERPWATVLRVPTAHGVAWFKACSAVQAFGASRRGSSHAGPTVSPRCSPATRSGRSSSSPDRIPPPTWSTPAPIGPHVGVVASTCFRQFEFAGVLHGARNPAGARALIDFFLSRHFQEDMPLQMYVNPVTVDARLPAVYAKNTVTPPHPYRMDPESIGEHRDAWIKQWTDIAVR